MYVRSGTSPEVSIKTAYGFAKVLRDSGVGEDDFLRQCAVWVEHRYATSPLLPCIRAGFEAGFFARPLPWVRQVVHHVDTGSCSGASPSPGGESERKVGPRTASLDFMMGRP